MVWAISASSCGDLSRVMSHAAKLRAMKTELKQLREQLCVPNERPHARQKTSTEGRDKWVHRVSSCRDIVVMVTHTRPM